jgi:hypothetical protein
LLCESTEGDAPGLFFGNPEWTDYDFTFRMTKTTDEPSGNRGAVMAFRASNPDNHYRFAIGAAANKRSVIVRSVDAKVYTSDQFPGQVAEEGVVKPGQTYLMKVEVRGQVVRCFLDGVKLFEFSGLANPKGGVGIVPHAGNKYRFSDVSVTAPDGSVLWQGLPALPKSAAPPGSRMAVVAGKDQWRIAGKELIGGSTGTHLSLLFGDPAWQDYDFSFRATRVHGPQSLSVLFRAPDLDNQYRVRFGANAGKTSFMERLVDGKSEPGPLPFRTEQESFVQTGQAYLLRVQVRGKEVHCFIDDVLLLKYSDLGNANGRVGFMVAGSNTGSGTWRIADLRVTAPDGAVLWEGLPELLK